MEDNIQGRKVAIDLVKANIFSIVLLAVTAVGLMLPFFLIWKDGGTLGTAMGTGRQWLVVLVAIITGIVVHELIHGVTWACFAPSGWKSISFGVIWKMLTPYCHCSEPLRKRQYMLGAMMPCLVLGVVPAAVALTIGSLPLLVWGIFFITAAAGDIWMTWLLTKERPGSLILDHPSEAGFYVLDDADYHKAL